MSKQIYSWNRVKAGDIISFRYESKGSSRLTTILVLNQKLLVSRIDETQTFHLVGLKLVLLMHAIESVNFVQKLMRKTFRILITKWI